MSRPLRRKGEPTRGVREAEASPPASAGETRAQVATAAAVQRYAADRRRLGSRLVVAFHDVHVHVHLPHHLPLHLPEPAPIRPRREAAFFETARMSREMSRL
ncbi:hypothetical protein [Mycolicibacterium sp. 050158]|uniref:hypothetical protein n=1 Tax=Mycolicibacterium sp. 050158 TaxID=3090602 RepID=UPI00299EE54D|nr:hypothetical protein [Mycolicibacterium sp. 050158]MDX1891405.1 hypothetical protein [Mycolicibacterium sp. 050158]